MKFLLWPEDEDDCPKLDLDLVKHRQAQMDMTAMRWTWTMTIVTCEELENIQKYSWTGKVAKLQSRKLTKSITDYRTGPNTEPYGIDTVLHHMQFQTECDRNVRMPFSFNRFLPGPLRSHQFHPCTFCPVI